MKIHPFSEGDSASERRRLAYDPRQYQLCRSNSQTVTAFGAASTDDSAAPTGRHTNEEAVGALAADNRRLIGTFHG